MLWQGSKVALTTFIASELLGGHQCASSGGEELEYAVRLDFRLGPVHLESLCDVVKIRA